MPSSTTRIPPQTLKKAKASYKARGRPSLTLQEQRQLERAIQLDRRAWGVKEREKRRAEAVKKRQEKENREREERARAQVGGDRRCDRFGFLASQVCLGAFFGRGRDGEDGKDAGIEEQLNEEKVREGLSVGQAPQNDDFGVEELDDDMLLSVLQPIPESRNKSANVSGGSTLPASTPLSKRTSPFPVQVDLDGFEEQLASSTQIARELDAPPAAAAVSVAAENTTSKAQRDLALMPPPMKRCDARHPRREMPQPEYPSHISRTLNMHSLHIPPTPAVVGFTIAELESFVEDDLRLTQADPG